MLDFFRKTKVFRFVQRGSPNRNHGLYNKVNGYDITSYLVAKTMKGAHLALYNAMSSLNVDITETIDSGRLSDFDLEQLDQEIFDEIEQNGIHCAMIARLA
ncbi:MAG TPA: hypothetical protein VEL07_15545 [Planctomycetota bacterium]|nr:hypothetical protein [Planctomycetota bacterium]